MAVNPLIRPWRLRCCQKSGFSPPKRRAPRRIKALTGFDRHACVVEYEDEGRVIQLSRGELVFPGMSGSGWQSCIEPCRICGKPVERGLDSVDQNPVYSCLSVGERGSSNGNSLRFLP